MIIGVTTILIRDSLENQEVEKVGLRKLKPTIFWKCYMKFKSHIKRVNLLHLFYAGTTFACIKLNCVIYGLHIV